jgi:hypothetical protein
MTSKKTFNINNQGSQNNIFQGENINVNIKQADVIKTKINDLANLLSSSLKDKDEQVQNLTQQLIEHSNKPAEKRDKLTIATILGTISNYINLLGDTTTQIQKIKQLFEQVRLFFGF